jgi:cysteine-rich repeat protein
VIDPGEPCDGGALCSATCTILPADGCPGSPVTVGTDPVTLQGDTTTFTDDTQGRCVGTDDGVDVVYAITTSAGGTLALFLDTGAALRLYVRRSCDDESPPGQLACDDGFGASALIWAQPGETFWVFVDGQDGSAAAKGSYSLHARIHPCGDGTRELLEECDDPMDPECVGCLLCAGANQLWDHDVQRRRCYTRVDGVPLGNAWDEAREACAPYGDLASIESTEVRNRIDFVTLTGALVGATDYVQNDDFRWMDQSPLWFAPWSGGQPSGNGQCVSWWPGTGLYAHDCLDDPWEAFCERAPIGGCGDGVAQGIEECDDGNAIAGDGCAPDCTVECDPPDVEEKDTHRCYRLVTGPDSWTAAAADCVQWGGWLVDITSPAEQAFVDDLVGQTEVWIGANGPNPYDFFWTKSGEDNVYMNWVGSPVFADCGFMTDDGHWDRADCGAGSKAWVCERKPAGTP